MSEKETDLHTYASRFEAETRDFLQKLGFADVNGGVTFKLGGEQIDAIGGKNGVVIIVECKYRSKIEKGGNIRNHVASFRGKIKNIERGLKKDPVYSKYSQIRYVLATKRYQFPKINRDYAISNPRIHILTEQDTEYYTSLEKAIGEYARYDFFGELQVKNESDPIRVLAFKHRIEGKTVYYFAVSAKELLKSSYVARREQGDEKYYQRMVKAERLNSICEYIDEKEGFFPNDIILSINEKCSFFPAKSLVLDDNRRQDLTPSLSKGELGMLQFPSKYRSCWIVDGQHRLYAFSKTKKDQAVFVVAFDNLPVQEQIKYFIDINGEQKPVDPDLLWDLEGQLRPESKEGQISNTIKKLNSSPVFYQRIYVPLAGQKKNGMIKLSAFCNALLRIRLLEDRSLQNFPKKKNPLYFASHKKIVQAGSSALISYFSAVKKLFKKEALDDLWFTNAGIGVLIYIYARLINLTGILPDSKKVEFYLSPLNKFLEKNPSKIEDYKTMLNSEGGRTHVTDQFMQIISDAVNDDRLVMGTSGLSPALEKEFKHVEDNLRLCINSNLKKKYGKDWIKSALPKETKDRLESAKRSKGQDDNRNELFEFLTLGQIRDLVMQDRWDIFRKVFITEEGFVSKQELEGAFERISKARNPTAHTNTYRVSPGNESMIRTYLQRINSSLT